MSPTQPPAAPSPVAGHTRSDAPLDADRNGIIDSFDEPKGTPHVEPAHPKATPPQDAEDTGRYSAYDTTYAKFVGGVHDSKGKARDAAKAAGSTDFEIVEV